MPETPILSEIAVDANAALKTSIQNGGVNEISVAGLSGTLGDAQTPINHASGHQNTGADEISVAGLSGLLADDQHTFCSRGEYTGDDAANRAIAHGLGVAPKLIFIWGEAAFTAITRGFIMGTYQWCATGATMTVTTADATNFYVSETDASCELNDNAVVYTWVAIG